MEEAEQLFLSDPEWLKQCNLEYLDSANPTVGTCRKPLSALNFYKASVWDSTLTQSILDRLPAQVSGIPDKGEATTGQALYTSLGFCLMYEIGCDSLAALGLTEAEQLTAANFAILLNADFTTVTDKFDGLGAINANPAEVTNFVAHMKMIPLQAFKVSTLCVCLFVCLFVCCLFVCLFVC